MVCDLCGLTCDFFKFDGLKCIQFCAFSRYRTLNFEFLMFSWASDSLSGTNSQSAT